MSDVHLHLTCTSSCHLTSGKSESESELWKSKKKSLIVTNRPECHCLKTGKVCHWHKRDKIGFEVSQGFEGFLTFAFFSWSQKRDSSENNNKIIQPYSEESAILAILNYSSYRVKVIELVIFSFNR